MSGRSARHAGSECPRSIRLFTSHACVWPLCFVKSLTALHPCPFTHTGVCGKTPETAYLQDLLTYSIKGLACWTDFAAKQGVEVPAEVYSFLHAATFATLTNVNFDDARFKVGSKREGRSERACVSTGAHVQTHVARSAAVHADPSSVSPCMHSVDSAMPSPPHPDRST